jgi:hypothetical protein
MFSKFLAGANEIQWANMITLENDCMPFFPKKPFSYEWTLKQIFVWFVIINVYGWMQDIMVHFWCQSDNFSRVFCV